MEDSDSLPSESKQKAKLLQTLISGPIPSSAAKLSGRSRAIPLGKDFHFYNNFKEFKLPTKEIAGKAESSLQSIASSEALWDFKKPPPFPADLDEAYDWLVNLNDEFLERLGVSLDEFRRLREKEEEAGERTRLAEMEEGGFQLVYGKKKKKEGGIDNNEKDGSSADAGLEVKMASKDKKTTGVRSKVPFHIPTIPRPQDEFNILVNNKNQPFEHVWLDRSEDGSRFVHPLEKLSLLDFIDRDVEGEPVKPLPLEFTHFKLVEGVKELKELAAKLRDANEFAVDLEHNHYRSFQGLTCLMQISTRTEDFIIDTLKLRVHIGPYLRDIFKDPSKRKVMHGADRDIVWLQRDFGIYVCNLFDTGQASRIMQLERNSLEFLLLHFCGVNANKEYQNADWRLRPLPDEMVKYAREDTHYLLHIYDLMKRRLLSASSDENDLLLEVYKRSYEICMHLYEKELLTDTSYLYIYGLQEADFNSKQLAIVAGLCAWRDKVARDEDESTGYILPNKILLEIARQMPLSSGKLRRMVKSKHPFVERHLNTVINIIRRSVEHSSAFESISEQLKKGREEASSMQNIEEPESKSEAMHVTEDPLDSTIARRDSVDGAFNDIIMQNSVHVAATMDSMDDSVKPVNTEHCSGQITSYSRCHEEEKFHPVGLADTAGTAKKENVDNEMAESLKSTNKAGVPSVQISVKPTCAFGALLGNSSRRKLNPGKGCISEQDKNETKVELIKSSVTLPFHSFSGIKNPSEPGPTKTIELSLPEILQQCTDQPPETTMLEEIIPLENDETDSSRSSIESPTAGDGPGGDEGSHPESETTEGSSSLAELSSSFQQCFQSVSQRGSSSSKQNQRQSREPEIKFQVTPFDYAAARKNIKFGGMGEVEDGDGDEGINKTYADTKAASHRVPADRVNAERGGGFKQPRRSQAFPPSGNRSMTYH